MTYCTVTVATIDYRKKKYVYFLSRKFLFSKLIVCCFFLCFELESGIPITSATIRMKIHSKNVLEFGAIHSLSHTHIRRASNGQTIKSVYSPASEFELNMFNGIWLFISFSLSSFLFLRIPQLTHETVTQVKNMSSIWALNFLRLPFDIWPKHTRPTFIFGALCWRHQSNAWNLNEGEGDGERFNDDRAFEWNGLVKMSSVDRRYTGECSMVRNTWGLRRVIFVLDG